MLYYRYSAPTPCDMQIPRSYCIARLLGSSVVPSFVVLNIAITVQRAMATFGASRRRQMAASRALIGVSALYAIGYGVYTYVPEPMDGYATYCSAITMFSGVRVILNIYVMFALDIFNVMGSFCLYKYNKHQLESKPNYHLGRKYNHLVNVSVLSKSLFMQIIHTIVYFFLFGDLTGIQKSEPGKCVAYVIVGIALKNSNSAKDYFVVNALMNVFPYYALVCPSVLTFLVRREDVNKRTRVQELITMASQSTTEYFKGLAKHWETAERASARA
ncbi:hypothetical protein PRIPAC_82258 [Pristionchus pacificus]|uniref:G protein-coupled receptor n=1 Tax=Pristionchus pacificus TaxID=54126 RepID=A0A2A6CQ93_PRIPA|nr:hypothetical protein PRIPAC_82258 [Pristionchus pacificus]|eukprot:PDM80227.1 G protein-coupled receptor [Pristionchus pacificus]